MTWPFKTYQASLDALDEVRYAMQRRAYDEAATHLAEARAGIGDDQRILIASAEIAQAQGLWPESQRRWQLVIDKFPDVPIAYAQRALAVKLQGNFLYAAKLFQDLIRRFPNDVGAPISLVHLIEELDEPDRPTYCAIADAGLN